MEENKVYYDIEETPFKYEKFGYIFYFTSNFNWERYINNVKKYIKEENLKNQSKYKVNIDFSIMLAMAYYLKIEKRAHKVLWKNKDIIKEGVIYGTTLNPLA